MFVMKVQLRVTVWVIWLCPSIVCILNYHFRRHRGLLVSFKKINVWNIRKVGLCLPVISLTVLPFSRFQGGWFACLRLLFACLCLSLNRWKIFNIWVIFLFQSIFSVPIGFRDIVTAYRMPPYIEDSLSLLSQFLSECTPKKESKPWNLII